MITAAIDTPIKEACAGTCLKCASKQSRIELTNRERFLSACHRQPVDRPPVWLMRQAGRCLPEYRAIKEKFSFVQIVQTPELATEVTLQPIRRFGFDAAILFSDILVVPEALGQGYHFHDKGGVEMEFHLSSRADIDRLQVTAIEERLQYVAQALPMIKEALHGETALIGFAGAPWTLANYMLEGSSSKEFTKAKQLFYDDPVLFEYLMEKLTVAVTAFLQLQIDNGVDAIQIFDSQAGALSAGSYEGASGRWIQQIINGLKKQVPVILFAKGATGSRNSLVRSGAQVLGVDWTFNVREVWDHLPKNIGIQGNLDPFLLTTTPEIVAREAGRILNEMRDAPGFIFNLGHGVPPTAKLENIEALVDTVRHFQ
jgi:uroporphyrinogen decarboxylase